MRTFLRPVVAFSLVFAAMAGTAGAKDEKTEKGVKATQSLLCKKEVGVGKVDIKNPVAGSMTEGACNCLDSMVNFFTASKGVKAKGPEIKSMIDSLTKELTDAKNETTGDAVENTLFGAIDTAAQGVFKNMNELVTALEAIGDDPSCKTLNELAAKMSSMMLSLQGLGDVVNKFMDYVGPDGGRGTINKKKFAQGSKSWADGMIALFKPVQGVIAAVTCLASICTDLPKLIEEYSALHQDPSFQAAVKEDQWKLIGESYRASDNPVQGVLASTVATVAVAGNNYGDAAVSALGLDKPVTAVQAGDNVQCCSQCRQEFRTNTILGRRAPGNTACGDEVCGKTVGGPDDCRDRDGDWIANAGPGCAAQGAANGNTFYRYSSSQHLGWVPRDQCK